MQLHLCHYVAYNLNNDISYCYVTKYSRSRSVIFRFVLEITEEQLRGPMGTPGVPSRRGSAVGLSAFP